MKNRFIILIDFSDYSTNQIKYAKKWSEINDAEIILVHNTIPLIPTMTDDKGKEDIRKNTNQSAQEKLRLLAEQTVEETSNFNYLASERNIENILNDLLKEQNYNNIIIIGLRGTNNTLRKILMGSFALNIIENTKNIIITLPKETKQFESGSLFVAVNKNFPVNFNYFDKLLSSFKSTVPLIHFFSVIKKGESSKDAQTYLNDLEDHYKGKAPISQCIMEGDDVLTEVKELLHNREHNLLVIQKGSRLFIDKIFRRFLINDLMHDGNIPLVILP